MNDAAYPVLDSAARAGRAVSELYREAVTEHTFEHRRSRLLIHLEFDKQLPGTEVVPGYDAYLAGQGWESGRLRIGPGLREVGLDEQRRVLLGGMHAVALMMAQSVAADPAPLEGAYRSVLARPSLDYEQFGPWRHAPGRKVRARARYTCAPDGYGRSIVIFETTDGLSASSRPVLAPTVASGFRMSAATLSWLTPECVSFTPFARRKIGFLGDPQVICVSRNDAGELVLDESPEPPDPDAQAQRAR